MIVYTESSRIWDVKSSFEVQYPGLTVEIHHIRGIELLEMLKSNAETGSYHCDVSICSDTNGIIANELVPSGVLYKYVPWDMTDKILPEFQQEQLEFVRELFVLFYNSEAYTACPISNWWQLTEEAYYGKVMMPNPQDSTSTYGFISAVLRSDDYLLNAYVDYYGGPPPLQPAQTASEYFMQRLVDNGLILTSSGTELIELVGAPGQAEPPFGLTVSSKIRSRDAGMQVAVAWDMEPFVGSYSCNSVMLARGSSHVSTAKLFIRWLLGEADGKGAGYRPYLQEGAWSVRADIQSDAAAEIEAFTVLPRDKAYAYQNMDAIHAFWISLYD